MAREQLNPDGMPPPVGPYSNVVATGPGKLVFCAGAVASTPTARSWDEGDIVAQTRQMMENLKLALEAAGATLRRCRQDQQLHDRLRPVLADGRRARASTSPSPTRPAPLVEVSALMEPELMIEIEAVAVVQGRRLMSGPAEATRW